MKQEIYEKSIDPATQTMLRKAEEEGIETAWDRYEKQLPQCSFGQLGVCCRNCNMGPCRIDPFGEGADRGICGATADIIVARNLLRTIAAGAAAHSDHARDSVLTFKKMSEGEAGSYRIKDEAKLFPLHRNMGFPQWEEAKRKWQPDSPTHCFWNLENRTDTSSVPEELPNPGSNSGPNLE
jgi:carbon-monoxide dehydrogenase catalytic subunit